MLDGWNRRGGEAAVRRVPAGGAFPTSHALAGLRVFAPGVRCLPAGADVGHKHALHRLGNGAELDMGVDVLSQDSDATES